MQGFRGQNVQSSATSDDFPYFQSGRCINNQESFSVALHFEPFYHTGSESEDSEEVERLDPELGRRQERKQNVLERGKVEGLRGRGQQGRGQERLGAWRGGRGNWGRGLGPAQMPRKTILVKQTLI